MSACSRPHDGQITTPPSEQREKTGVRSTESTPDKGWAWVVALAAMVNQIIGVGMCRASGIVVVELMDVFEASATKAALIYSFIAIGYAATAVLYMCGIGEYVHERGLIAASGFMACIGYIITYFSTRIEHIFVQAFLAGAARQIGTASGQEIVARYFIRRRSFANGIAMTGGSLGVLVLPPVTQLLLNEYSYRGTALVSGAFVLNSLVCSALMRPFRQSQAPKEATLNPNDMETTLNGNHPRNISNHDNHETHPDQDSQDPISNNHQETITSTDGEETTKPPVDNSNPLVSQELDGIYNTAYVHEKKDVDCNPQNDTENPPVKSANPSCSKVTLNAVKEFALKDKERRPGETQPVAKTLFLGVLLFKQSLVVCFLVFSFFSSLGSECLVQFYPASTKEFGMSDYETAFLLSIVGIGDVFSRLTMGLLGDCKLMARYKLVVIPQLVLGSACLLSRFATAFWSQAMFAVVIGLTYGVGNSFRAVLILDFFGLQDLSRLIGINNMVVGLGFTAGGPLIGYLRDMTGDYKVAMMFLAAVFYIAGFILLATGAFKWYQEQKSKA